MVKPTHLTSPSSVRNGLFTALGLVLVLFALTTRFVPAQAAAPAQMDHDTATPTPAATGEEMNGDMMHGTMSMAEMGQMMDEMMAQMQSMMAMMPADDDESKPGMLSMHEMSMMHQHMAMMHQQMGMMHQHMGMMQMMMGMMMSHGMMGEGMMGEGMMGEGMMGEGMDETATPTPAAAAPEAAATDQPAATATPEPVASATPTAAVDHTDHPAPGLATTAQKATAGAVTVEAVPLVTDDVLDVAFAITLETHSVELDFDLAERATLTIGDAKFPGASWQPNAPDGHHVEGVLHFTIDHPAHALLFEVDTITLELREIDEATVTLTFAVGAE